MIIETPELPHGVKFAEKWIEWIQFRKDLRKPYKTQKGINGALNQLKAVSETEACQMIDNSMAGEYQGLFPVKKKFEKGATSETVAWNKPTQVSQEPAKKFDPEDGKNFIIGKIQRAYETGSRLNDVGEVFTNRLKPFLSTPEDVRERIALEVQEEADTPPRNKFIEKVEINVPLEIRNRIIRYNMDIWRENNNKVYEQI